MTLSAWQSAPPKQTAAQSPVTQSDNSRPRLITQLVEKSRRFQDAVERPLTTPYRKWINEDVVYIISDDERAAFLKLTTDEEREKFIEQFWVRRDPTPGTVENEFKQEHYRRIAYANQHFALASGRPGWQTDRGHMYIVYGPPDEIDAHQSGTAQTPYPYEVWIYRHVQGLGDNLSVTFVDTTGSRDYHLVPGPSK
ncbi:MAG TPA: GWxTD domain-containing protein [Bryobacteraceae bacterium]|nr:GWxTD domain-containing protein [Bryobacteraceae bacterium]